MIYFVLNLLSFTIYLPPERTFVIILGPTIFFISFPSQLGQPILPKILLLFFKPEKHNSFGRNVAKRSNYTPAILFNSSLPFPPLLFFFFFCFSEWSNTHISNK